MCPRSFHKALSTPGLRSILSRRSWFSESWLLSAAGGDCVKKGRGERRKLDLNVDYSLGLRSEGAFSDH